MLFFTCNYVVSVWRGFLFLWVLGMGYVILLWHSLSLHIIILEALKAKNLNAKFLIGKALFLPPFKGIENRFQYHVWFQPQT